MNDSAKSVLCEEKIEKNLSDKRLENAVSSTEFEVAAQRFRQLAKEEGIETAAGLWICRPLKQWIKNLNKTQSLQNASPHLDRNSLLHLAVGMNNSLHIRDCLLVSAVSDCDFDSLSEDYFVLPLTKGGQELLRRLVSSARENVCRRKPREWCGFPFGQCGYSGHWRAYTARGQAAPPCPEAPS